jgi:uncharacterized protein (DUF1330 family)
MVLTILKLIQKFQAQIEYKKAGSIRYEGKSRNISIVDGI